MQIVGPKPDLYPGQLQADTVPACGGGASCSPDT